MLAVDKEICALLYAIYLSDCIHWLRRGEAVVTRGARGALKLTVNTGVGYLLLGRQPVLANPLDLRPGLAVAERSDGLLEGAEAHVKENWNEYASLVALGYFLFFTLLIFLPTLLLLHILDATWRIVVLMLVFLWASVAIEFHLSARKLQATRNANYNKEFISVLLNPLLAIRAASLLMRLAVSEGAHQTDTDTGA